MRKGTWRGSRGLKGECEWWCVVRRCCCCLWIPRHLAAWRRWGASDRLGFLPCGSVVGSWSCEVAGSNTRSQGQCDWSSSGCLRGCLARDAKSRMEGLAAKGQRKCAMHQKPFNPQQQHSQALCIYVTIANRACLMVLFAMVGAASLGLVGVGRRPIGLCRDWSVSSTDQLGLPSPSRHTMEVTHAPVRDCCKLWARALDSVIIDAWSFGFIMLSAQSRQFSKNDFRTRYL